mgnify:CR=1 FL=1
MVAFATREPTDEELENFRLALSLVNHGIGAYNGGEEGIPISPHWSWVERAYAAAFNGILVPGKAAFDVPRIGQKFRPTDLLYHRDADYVVHLGLALSPADSALSGDFDVIPRRHVEFKEF